MSIKSKLSKGKHIIRERLIIPCNRRRLTNQNISIISPNCVGGIILHELGLRFNTPTINLFFEGLEYFVFLENLRYYLNADVTASAEETQRMGYPVLKIVGGVEKLPDIYLYCVHYRSCEDAADAWKRRAKRVIFEHLYVVCIAGGAWWNDSNKHSLLERFERLPFSHKIFFVNENIDTTRYPHAFYLRGFENEKYLGQVLDFTGYFGKRYIDQFDWVSWLNS